MDVRLPDGTVISNVPDGMSKAELTEKLGRNGYDISKLSAAPEARPSVSDSSIVATGAGLGAGVGQVALGAQRYLGKGLDALGAEKAGQWLINDAEQGRAKLAGELAPYKEKSPIAAGGGEIAGNVLATLPVGGGLAAGVKAISQAPRAVQFANALQSGGFRSGGAPGAANVLTRTAGGATTGGASAALVNPDDAGTGAVIGGILPPAMAGLGKLGAATGNVLRGGGASDEVRQLAARAKDLGIDIPADRLVSSKPMNALAASLNYVPFSGRAATEATMENQLTRAATRTFGQDSTNMTQAIRKAGDELGGKFDDVLKNNSVNFSEKFMKDITNIYNTAQKELGSDGLKAIGGQIDELISKGSTGVIDGQAAYNIKRTLDRIGKRNTPEAYHALELKKSLMDALNESIGPEAAAAFAKTRQQYGNMLALEKLAKNGADGDISVARLANMQNINNKPLQEIADIAAQFVKPREGQHGAMQRAFVGLGAGSLGGIPGLALAAGAGRTANTALNSGIAKNFLLKEPGSYGALGTGFNALADNTAPTLYRAAPVLSTSR